MNGFILYQQATHINEFGCLFKFVNGKLFEFKRSSIGHRWIPSSEPGYLYALGHH